METTARTAPWAALTPTTAADATPGSGADPSSPQRGVDLGRVERISDVTHQCVRPARRCPSQSDLISPLGSTGMVGPGDVRLTLLLVRFRRAVA